MDSGDQQLESEDDELSIVLGPSELNAAGRKKRGACKDAIRESDTEDEIMPYKKRAKLVDTANLDDQLSNLKCKIGTGGGQRGRPKKENKEAMAYDKSLEE